MMSSYIKVLRPIYSYAIMLIRNNFQQIEFL